MLHLYLIPVHHSPAYQIPQPASERGFDTLLQNAMATEVQIHTPKSRVCGDCHGFQKNPIT